MLKFMFHSFENFYSVCDLSLVKLLVLFSFSLLVGKTKRNPYFCVSQDTENSEERLLKSESISKEGLQNQTIHGISHKIYIYTYTKTPKSRVWLANLLDYS